MASEAIKGKGVLTTGLPGVYRVLAAEVIAGALGAAASAAIGLEAAAGFVAGFSLGVVNMLWLLRIANRSLRMAPERATRYVALRYYLRFLLTAGVLVFLITEGVLKDPWALVAGITIALFSAVAAMIPVAREETSR